MSNHIKIAKMKFDDYINEYIEKEKQTSSNPFLSTRIMAKIEAGNERTIKKAPILQRVALAASISMVVLLGFGIGKIYNPSEKQEIALNINDNQIENFSLYNFEEYENQ